MVAVRPFIKFGFHDFINAKPVLKPLARLSEQAGFELVIDHPANLAGMLASGKIDCAMIPSVEYLTRASEYLLIPGLSIASKGEVGTVLFATGKPLSEVRTVALDQRSRTSVALLKILFASSLSPEVRYIPCQPDPVKMLNSHDAALIIGDPAFHLDHGDPERTVFDLSREWYVRTGKSFVHAVVAARRKANINQILLDAVKQARAERFAFLEGIVNEEMEKTGLGEEVLRDYLARKIVYDLGEKEIEGLKLFQRLCRDHGIIKKIHPMEYAGPGLWSKSPNPPYND